MTPSERILHLPVELMSVRRGRIFARDVVNEWGLDELADDVQLAVSELITNAVRHAGTDVVLSLCLEDRLVVEVRDSDPELDHPLTGVAADPLATSGRGLQIVAAVSADWGVRTSSRGKAVWFALDLPDTASPDADVYAMSGRRPGEAADGASEDDDESGDSRELQARAVN
jgi:anti-sigma regulatory factor (Ser/Thr protein kinase)